MDITQLPLDQILSNGIFACLFLWLLIDTRKEAKQREEKMYFQIDKQNEAQDKIVKSLERLENQISQLQNEK
ncbi:BhlA/UviB family holin-like peptide [Rossellomorea marisflavi]|uniref:BhlA/UviB family holin-like peptide n=1 Tax=Rossellomorea marisflavi TaxID=189381 RepID=UPI00203B44E9|nr:BhlA/UviB family holin-like peptide [Rossellomorea marisflavi]MCM2603748.1 BhlA/UviB family holin-like peptide [Rossellomorea marisflavi]